MQTWTQTAVVVENCVDTEAWAWGSVFEADEDADAWIKQRVRSCGQSQNLWCNRQGSRWELVKHVKNVDVDSAISRWCNGSLA